MVSITINSSACLCLQASIDKLNCSFSSSDLCSYTTNSNSLQLCLQSYFTIKSLKTTHMGNEHCVLMNYLQFQLINLVVELLVGLMMQQCLFLILLRQLLLFSPQCLFRFSTLVLKQGILIMKTDKQGHNTVPNP